MSEEITALQLNEWLNDAMNDTKRSAKDRDMLLEVSMEMHRILDVLEQCLLMGNWEGCQVAKGVGLSCLRFHRRIPDQSDALPSEQGWGPMYCASCGKYRNKCKGC